MVYTSHDQPPESIRAWRDTPQRREVRQEAFSACLFSNPTLQALSFWRGHEIWNDWVKEDNRLTALLLACQQPISPALILPFLLEHGLDVRARTACGKGALHLAAQGSRKYRLAWCQALIQAGADMGATTKKGHSPLITSALRGAKELFDFFLANGMKPSHADHEAIFQTNHPDILKDFWRRFGMTLSLEERTLQALLSGRESRWHLVRALMPYGIDIHACLDGETILLLTRNGRKFPSDLVENFVYQGADPEQTHPISGLTLRELIQKRHGAGSQDKLHKLLGSLDGAISRGRRRRMEEALPPSIKADNTPRLRSARL